MFSKVIEELNKISSKKFKRDFIFKPIIPSPKVLTFVDGGNAEILKSNSFSLQFLRIAFVTYDGKKKIEQGIEECYVLSQLKDNTVSTQIMGIDIKIPDLKEDVSKVPELVRRFLEVRLAKKKNGILDGNKKEEAFISIPSDLSAIAKTNEMIFGDVSLNVSLNQSAKLKIWSCFFNNKLYVKLHPSSRYVFQIETNKDILSGLAFISSDPVFFGYPYGMIEVDKLARISNEEKKYLQTKVLLNVDNKNIISQHLNTHNAHDILDGKKNI